MGKITKKQKQVYDYICSYIEENGYAPTQKEIGEYFGLKSLGSVQDYIKYLVNAGYLKNDPNSVRGLEPAVLDFFSHPRLSESKVSENNYAHELNNINQSNLIDIPLMGKVAAGIPIEAVEGSDSISVPSSLIKTTKSGKQAGVHFALTVQGNSMIEDGILDGDIIIVKQQSSASNGETVVATINNEATVKRYKKEKNDILLIPANSSMKPIAVSPSDPFEIKGILVGLFRSY
jgi:SOS regulatory protein LexA